MPDKMLLSEVVRATQRIMYFELVHDQKESWTRADLVSRLGERASRYLVARSLDRLETLKHVRRTDALNELTRLLSGDDGSTFDFTEVGFVQAEADYHSEVSTKDVSFDELYGLYIAHRLEASDSARGSDLDSIDAEGADLIYSNVLAAPASDRVVRLDDNAPGRLDAIEHLVELSSSLASRSNDLPLEAEDRRVVASEINPLIERLRSGQVRVGEIASAVTKGSPLVWLADKLAGLTLGGVVALALGALGLLLRSLLT